MTEVFESTIEEELLKNGSFAICAKGESMRPMLRGGKDMVIIAKRPLEIRKYDVILFKDKRQRYVLHRVVKVKDGFYLTRGDNTYFEEHVDEECVLGILTRYNKDGKSYDVNSFSSKLYARQRVFFYPVRKLLLKIRKRLSCLYRKFFKKRQK